MASPHACLGSLLTSPWVVSRCCCYLYRTAQIQDYALYQLRDTPGQQKLRGFADVRPSALPAAAIYGSHAGSVGQELDAVAEPAAVAAAAAAPSPAAAAPAAGASAAAEAAGGEQPTCSAGGAPGEGREAGRPASGFDAPLALQQAPPVQLAAQQQQRDQQPPTALLQQQQQQQQQPRDRSTSRSPRPGSGGGGAGRLPVSPGHGGGEMQEAQQLAARLRAECDMLK